MSGNTKDKKKNKKRKKRKINWSEYNESLVRRGEVMFDTDFLDNWRAELKIMNKGKEGAKYLYPNSLISLARHRTCVPSTLQAAGRISKNDVNTHRKTARSNTRLHHDVVEGGKGKGTSKSRGKP